MNRTYGPSLQTRDSLSGPLNFVVDGPTATSLSDGCAIGLQSDGPCDVEPQCYGLKVIYGQNVGGMSNSKL